MSNHDPIRAELRRLMKIARITGDWGPANEAAYRLFLGPQEGGEARMEGPAVPPAEGREPAAVVGEASDLPANYIDAEHQGEDLELLQTFYRACQAEGGTADEIHLRGLRAVLATRPAAPPAPVPAEGEAGELVQWLERMAKAGMGGLDELNAARAATLLQQQAAELAELRSRAAPVPVEGGDVQYEFSVFDGDGCELAGGSAPTLQDAIREGEHYLSQYNREGDLPLLELQRVEIIALPYRAIPQPPQEGEEVEG